MNNDPKITSNRQKKMTIVAELAEKFGKANAVVFTSYRGLTHKQIEGFKREIKPLKAEYVVAKNSLLTIALSENKLKLEEGVKLDGQTGTLFLYDDVLSPLKSLAKIIKELNLPSVKFGIMEKGFITGEQVIKLSTLPTKEVLLTQLVVGLKAPIFGLHRALNWNLQKLVMTLSAITKVKPQTENVKTTTQNPEPTQSPIASTPVSNTTTEPDKQAEGAVQSPAEESEPEAIQDETTADGAASDVHASSEAMQAKAAEEPEPNLNTPEPEAIQDETAAELVAELPDEPADEVSAAQSPQGTENNEQIKQEVASNPTDKGGEN